MSDDDPPEPLREDRLALFATPVAVIQLAGTGELDRELSSRLTAESRVVEGVRRSNGGGWHSAPDLALRAEPCYRAVVSLIVEHVGRHVSGLYERAGRAAPPVRYGAHAWAMVMRDGDYVVPHDHGDAHLSTAYYADAGDADGARHPDSGALALLDPRRGRSLPGLEAGATFLVRPRAGMLVIFPGWLAHYVHPYRGHRPRVTVSCNVLVEPRA